MTTPDPTQPETANRTTGSPLSANTARRFTNPLAWLTLLLAAQIMLIAYVYWPTDAATLASGPLLPDFDPGAIAEIQIEDSTGQAIHLQRTADGWAIADTDGYPANQVKVEETLAKLSAVNTNRLVTRTDTSHARLQVAEGDFNRKITLSGSDGGATTIYLGVSAGGAATHIRRAGDNLVYLTSQIAAWETEPFLSGWVNTTYHSINSEVLVGLTLRNAHGAIELTRSAGTVPMSQWTAADLDAGASLDVTEISSLINRVSFVSLTGILGQSAPVSSAAANPLVEVELRLAPSADAATEQPETITLHFGVYDAGTESSAESSNEQAYFAKSSTSAYYVRVAPFVVDQLVDVTLTGLIQSDPSTSQELTPSPTEVLAPALQAPDLDLTDPQELIDEFSRDDPAREQTPEEELPDGESSGAENSSEEFSDEEFDQEDVPDEN